MLELSFEERKESLRKQLNLTTWDSTFENFKHTKGAENALKLFKELSTLPGWFMLLCYGTSGNGKTHLCEALSIELYKRGIFCPVHEFAEIIRRFRTSFNSSDKWDYNLLFKRIQTAKYLILDDVGMGGSGSSWEWGELEEIISYRYKNELFTVMTTNLDLGDIPLRIVTRFQDAIKSRMVLNSGVNYRPLKGAK